MKAADHAGNAHRFSEGRPVRQIFQRLTTAELPARERYDYWRETVVRIARADPPSEAQHRNFEASVVSVAAPHFELHFAAFDGFRARLSGSAAARHRGEDPSLFYVASGQVLNEEEGSGRAEAKSGDFILWDPGRAGGIAFGRSRIVQLDLPRTMLQAELGAVPDGSILTRALRTSRLTTLLKAQLDALESELVHMTPPEQALALQATQALAVSVLKGVLAGGGLIAGEGEQDRRLGLFSAARRYIDHRLGDPSLNADAVARALGCSRSSLYRAFSHQALGVADYIRDLRLQRFRALLEQGPDARSIADLAAQCGLYDTPNISRMFRAHFGLSPSEYRRQSRQVPEQPKGRGREGTGRST